MIIVQFKAHVRQRLSEWQMAFIMTAWGCILFSPSYRFDDVAVYEGLARIADESVWGVAAITVGCVRIAALAVNGLWRPSYELRAMCAFGSIFVWFTIALGLLSAPRLSTAHAVYPILLIIEMANLYYAAIDGRMARLKAEVTGGRAR